MVHQKLPSFRKKNNQILYTATSRIRSDEFCVAYETAGMVECRKETQCPESNAFFILWMFFFLFLTLARIRLRASNVQGSIKIHRPLAHDGAGACAPLPHQEPLVEARLKHGNILIQRNLGWVEICIMKMYCVCVFASVFRFTVSCAAFANFDGFLNGR